VPVLPRAHVKKFIAAISGSFDYPCYNKKMRLVSRITVHQNVDQVWEFLANPLNSHKWDKSIARVKLQDPGFVKLGSVIHTESPSGKKQSFVITQFEPPTLFAFKLLESSLFKEAELRFSISKAGEGSHIVHEINLTLKPYLFFAFPLLLLVSKKALGADLGYLKKALDTFAL